MPFSIGSSIIYFFLNLSRNVPNRLLKRPDNYFLKQYYSGKIQFRVQNTTILELEIGRLL